MGQSDSIQNIAAALSKFQSEVESAKKTSVNKNTTFTSKYADLAEVWETIRPHLSPNGLSISQGGDDDNCPPNTISIVTKVMHISGEWLSFKRILNLTVYRNGESVIKNDPQSCGSAITYARRYELAAALGIYQEDDDAETMTDRKGEYVDPAADNAAKEAKAQEKAVAQCHKDIEKAFKYLANNKIDGFDVPTRVYNSVDKHLGIKDADKDPLCYKKCRNVALMNSYLQMLRDKVSAWNNGNATAPAPTAGQIAHDKSELLIAIVRCNLTGEEKEDLQRLVNSAKTADDLEAVRKSLEGAK